MGWGRFGELEADDFALYPVYLALAEGTLAEAGFAAWLRRHTASGSGGALQEPRARDRR